MRLALYNSYFFTKHLDKDILKRYKDVLTYNFETSLYRLCIFQSPEFPHIVKVLRKSKLSDRVDSLSVVCEDKRSAKSFLHSPCYQEILLRKFNRLIKQKYMLI